MLPEYGDLKIVWHGEKLTSFFKKEITAPVYVRVKPTNKCDHKCFDCVYEPNFSGIHTGMSRMDEIPREKMLEILKDFHDMGIKAVTYSGGGEPLIYPHIEEILEKTLEYGINLSIITNGQNLNGKSAEILTNAHWVRISSNASNSKTFSQIRGKPEECFFKLIKNIENFAKNKKPNCMLGINFVVNHLNYNEVYDSAKFYKELGVNNIKFTPQWSPNFLKYHSEFKERVMQQIEKAKKELTDEHFKVYDTYGKDFELTGINERRYDKCYIMQTIPVVGADSKIYFCHNKAYSEDGCLGSIKDKSFRDLWFSEEAKKIFENFNPSCSCKHQCTNDLKNILIRDILDCNSEGVNFV